MNTVIENISTRRSVRSYKPDQISAKDLDAILLAGSYAPSAMGTQSWKITAIQSPEVLIKVDNALRQTILSIPVDPETNSYIQRLIERAKDETANFLYNAPTYIIVSSPADNKLSMADCALAIENMMLAAHSLGIGSCWLNQIAGFTNMPLIRTLLSELDVPENHNVYGSVAMGYAEGEPKPAAPRKDVINIIR